jgi:short-subunit dehydrogenase
MGILKRTVQATGMAAGIAAGLGMTAIALLRSRRARSMRGKVVVITGGSRGLGMELARQFGRAGAHLVLAARDEEELQRARVILAGEGAAHSASTIEIVVADVTLREDALRIIQAARQRFGRVDVLINNAGIIHVGPFVSQPEDAFEEAMATNFFGALYTIQAVVEEMRERGEGKIVNIASIGGKVAVPHLLPYVASKFALVGFSEGLHAELSADGIQVTTVCPGLIRSGSHVQARFAGRRQEEYRWFSAGATTPFVSIAVRRAAGQIFRAVVAGAAEITLTPQAWLAARAVGLAPASAQRAAGVVNRTMLPKPGAQPLTRGGQLRQPSLRLVKAWSEHLQTANNQVVQ